MAPAPVVAPKGCAHEFLAGLLPAVWLSSAQTAPLLLAAGTGTGLRPTKGLQERTAEVALGAPCKMMLVCINLVNVKESSPPKAGYGAQKVAAVPVPVPVPSPRAAEAGGEAALLGSWS